MRYILPVIVAFLFIIEGTWFQVFFPASFDQDLYWMPRFAFVAIVFISIYRGAVHGLFFGIITGFFHDVVYSYIIGIYMFSYGLLGYMAGFNFSAVKSRPIVVLLIMLVGLAGLETLIYFMYTWTGVAFVGFEEFATTRLMPSLLLNGAFGIVILFPMRKIFQWIEERERMQENV
ncbi:rod shape-determining protein MreD [Geomicrobium sp. JCM 19037]|uniref:rod shape-determining protein MreD n=1 Tax=unclassified Geomicrobium TaxID=2628951 RepID=UPI00045F3EC3|nr:MULTISPECIES: rod shape-determining protein MreD [unclassified Geomicrobium]GAK03199.1 rod shape-determining protein MreD [Geomicrobium sp. JCM 19037]GAK12599.1 rod shape-determining protein MreD [Geomicrobium sp. JCM 19039]